MKSHAYTVAGANLAAHEPPRAPVPVRHTRWCQGCRRRTWHRLTSGQQRCERCQQATPAVFR